MRLQSVILSTLCYDVVIAYRKRKYLSKLAGGAFLDQNYSTARTVSRKENLITMDRRESPRRNSRQNIQTDRSSDEF